MIGRRFKVNLSNATWSQSDIPADWVLAYAGGVGLALKAFLEHFEATGEGSVVMAPGLFAGTNAPAGHWASMVFRDPESGRVSSSYFGGHWGSGLRFSGASLLEISGRAPSPTVLVLEDGRVRFVAASGLKGLSPKDLCQRLEELLGPGYLVAGIGPAAEMAIPIASLIFDGTYQRQSAGAGAAFGQIGLKAVAVKGNEKIVPAIPTAFFSEARALRNRFIQERFPYRELASYGTAWFLKELHRQAMLPVRNFTTSILPGWEMLSGDYISDSVKRRPIACFGCPVACRWTTPVNGAWHEGPQIEEVVALGTLCGITDPKVLLQIKAHCDRLAIDPLAFGARLAAAMEKGDGRPPLTFGDGETVVKVLDQERDPWAALVNLGVLSVGTGPHPERPLFMVTDPRADDCLALSRSTWPLDAPHVLGSSAFAGRLPLFEGEGNLDAARSVKLYQDFYLGLQSVGFCPWASLAFTASGLDPLVKAAIGDGLPDRAALHFGENVFNLAASAGLVSESDTPPLELFRGLAEEPIPDGPRRGKRLDIAKSWPDYRALRSSAMAGSRPSREGAC
jgi:aldehyde:ferredoxin oxidoreductase